MSSDDRADKQKLLRFIFDEYAHRVKVKPQDKTLRSFYLFMKNNPDEIWRVILREFAARYPEVETEDSEIELDELCFLVGTLPSLIRDKIAKYVRINESNKMSKLTRELKILSSLLTEKEFKPSMFEKMTFQTPRLRCQYPFCGTLIYYFNPKQRLAVRAIKRYFHKPELWVARSHRQAFSSDFRYKHGSAMVSSTPPLGSSRAFFY